MAKYSKGAQKAVGSAMKRMEKGTLKSGKSDKKVTNPKQAIAIGLSEAKKKGAKVPAKKSASKSVTKKTAPKKVAKKAVKKAAPKKAAAKQAPAKKATVKKAAATKTQPVKSPAKKVNSKKALANKKIGEVVEVENDTVIAAANNSPVPDQQPPVEERSPAVVPKVEDPLLAVDKKLMARSVTKSDPRHNMPVSSINKSRVKPSGKKPLWPR